MNVTEVKEAVGAMPRQERAELAVYLRCLEIAEDAEYGREMERRARAMAQGDRFDRESVLGLN